VRIKVETDGKTVATTEVIEGHALLANAAMKTSRSRSHDSSDGRLMIRPAIAVVTSPFTQVTGSGVSCRGLLVIMPVLVN